MLARVADNIFWMGRYIERAEHMARYMNVNYFSSLDAPNAASQSRDLVLRSILNMAGITDHSKGKLRESEVLRRIGMDPGEAASVVNSIKNARENAQAARDLISTELYESINKCYHFSMDYPTEKFVKTGLFDFTTQITEMTAIIRGKIRGTLLHDAIYAIIMMGVNLERAFQISRIINSKYNDAHQMTEGEEENFRNCYEWTTLLKCTESYDMMRRLYKKQPTSSSTLEFLILNPRCPRSVMNSLNQIYRHITMLDPMRIKDKDSSAFLVGKVRAEYQFKCVEDIDRNYSEFISGVQSALTDIAGSIQNEFFYH